jgi:hypothetical protein
MDIGHFHGHLPYHWTAISSIWIITAKHLHIILFIQYNSMLPEHYDIVTTK